MANRNLDGIFFRMKRDGKWQNICFSDLTASEREMVLADRNEAWLKNLCCHLADTIKNIGDQFNITGCED